MLPGTNLARVSYLILACILETNTYVILVNTFDILYSDTLVNKILNARL